MNILVECTTLVLKLLTTFIFQFVSKLLSVYNLSTLNKNLNNKDNFLLVIQCNDNSIKLNCIV